MSQSPIEWDDSIYGKKRLRVNGKLTNGFVCYNLRQAVGYVGDLEVFRGVSLDGAMDAVVESINKTKEVK